MGLAKTFSLDMNRPTTHELREESGMKVISIKTHLETVLKTQVGGSIDLTNVTKIIKNARHKLLPWILILDRLSTPFYFVMRVLHMENLI